ncbi:MULTISPECIES: class A beta-lactamase [unclassified Oceanobacillus]|uniref:class A beta-lactamase n=1 Tax=Oceanobacillus TaxID=182709 RepID=UPI001BE7B4D3|nr:MULTISPECIES: class A beta-lactamase [unclassified Oceanobacillus]MBT2600402.1 class A beta-lactamase [Oceanobacillus sp. ISL-74]MBT2650560.1 class A beta-lactamase [Oceanobacillus sp. ISL-73]
MMSILKRSSVLLLLLMLVGAVLMACSKEAESKEENPKVVEEKTDKGSEAFKKLEDEFDVKLGVYAIDTGSNKEINYQENDRFAYASTFKPLVVGAILQTKSDPELQEVIRYTEEDLVTYSPITEKHVDEGMTLLEISDAAIRYSDNTAANLLLEAIGGPDELETKLRDIGDETIEVDRYETELNEATPGDIRDTSTPKAMANSLQQYVLEDVLDADRREILTNMLINNTTGDALIRAGVPEGWTVGDKTGAGGYGTRNDIGIIWPEDNEEPIVIAIMSSRDVEDADYDDKLIEKATKIVVKELSN